MIKEIKFGIGTGSFYKENNYDINKAIQEIYNLGVKFIEITFGSRESFENLTLTKESLDLLKKFKLITIHAPFAPYKEDNQTKKLLTKLKKLYGLISAKYITFHPHYFNNFDLLLRFDWNVCIENSRPGKGWNFKKLKRLFEKYPQFGFVLDTCHAGEFSRKEIDLLFNEFKDRIKYFHLSAAHQGKSHQPLHTIDEEYLSQFSKIINFGKPLLIELWGPNLIKKELNFLKSKFS